MKKLIIFIFLISIHIETIQAQEYNNKHKKYIEIGLSPGLYSNSFMGGVYGAFGFYFKSFGKQSCIDFRATESYINQNKKIAGALTLTYRLYFTKGLYIGFGGAHNHEVKSKYFKESPAEVMFATHSHIHHRTGIIGEIGYDFKSIEKIKKISIYPSTNLSVAYLPGSTNANPLINLNVGLKFGIKKLEK